MTPRPSAARGTSTPRPAPPARGSATVLPACDQPVGQRPAVPEPPGAGGEHAQRHRHGRGQDAEHEPGREPAERPEPGPPAKRRSVEPERRAHRRPRSRARSRAAGPRPAPARTAASGERPVAPTRRRGSAARRRATAAARRGGSRGRRTPRRRRSPGGWAAGAGRASGRSIGPADPRAKGEDQRRRRARP